MVGARHRVAQLAALALLFAGCTSPYYADCDSDAECPDGWRCVPLGDDYLGEIDGCSPSCVRSEACAETLNDPNAYCASTGACVTACEADTDCPAGSRCSAWAGACAKGDVE